MTQEKNQDNKEQNNLRKKMIFRSWHRGMREIDILLGRFADEYLLNISYEEVLQYEELLKNNDPDLYNWITEKEEPPANANSDILKKIIKFYR